MKMTKATKNITLMIMVVALVMLLGIMATGAKVDSQNVAYAGTVAASLTYGVGNVSYYSSFEEAWGTAIGCNSEQTKNRATVTLFADVTAEEGSFGTGIGFGTTGASPNDTGNIFVPATKYLGIDLNGFTIDRGLAEARANGSVVLVLGDFLLTDSSIDGTGKLKGGNTTGEGGGVSVESGKFTMEGGTICENHAHWGGGVYVNGGEFIMKAPATISNNTVTHDGGGVYIYGNNTPVPGSFSMESGTIMSNSAPYSGGGVMVSMYSSMTMSDGIISKNSAQEGGGVYMASSEFTMSKGEITENTAKGGGGVCVPAGSKFKMIGGKISRNSAQSLYANNYGGGVYLRSTTNLRDGTVKESIFTMSGGEISYNTATGTGGAYGGGVYQYGVLNLSGSAQIFGNVLGGTITEGVLSGGTANNVHLSPENTVSISDNDEATTGDTFIGSVGITSEAADTASEPVIVTSGWGSSNGTILSDSPSFGVILFNSEKAFACATVKIGTGDEVYYLKFETAWNTAVAGGTSEENRATIKLLCDLTAVEGSFGTGIGFGPTGTSPNDSGNIFVPATKYLGIDLNGFTIDRGLTVAQSMGYVIYVNGDFLLTDSSINGTGKLKGGYDTGDGGGVKVRFGNFTIEGGTICENQAVSGGGVSVYGGTCTMKAPAKITQNTVENNGGGVLLIGAPGIIGTFSMSGGEISNNRAQSVGGGVAVNGEVDFSSGSSIAGIFTMSGGKISYNTTQSVGGGVFVSSRDGGDGIFTMSGGEISYNTAQSYGGGIYLMGKLNISGSAEILGNVSGGTITEGVLSGGTANNVYLLTGKTVTISDNDEATTGDTFIGSVGITSEAADTASEPVIVTSGWGSSNGTIISDIPFCGVTLLNSEKVLAAATVKIGTGDEVYYLKFETAWNAAVTGGTSEANRATIKLLDDWTAVGGSFGENSYLLVSGGVYLEIDLNGKTINRGLTETINDGYVIRVNGNLILSDSSPDADGKVTGGKTSQTSKASGGVYVSGTFIMKGGSISNNIGYLGGGVFLEYKSAVEPGVFIMEGGTISENSSSCGGGVYVSENTTMEMKSQAKISKNTGINGSSVIGGGVYDRGTFTMNGGEISENIGGNGGGVFIQSPASGSSSTFTMNGGEIRENIANGGSGGGGVFVSPGGKFTMTNGKITKNSVTATTLTHGGGVYISSRRTSRPPILGSITMSGGEISYNTTKGDGGGVYNDCGIFNLCGNTNIFGNVSGGTISEGELSGGTSSNVFVIAGIYINISDNNEATANDTFSGSVWVSTSTKPSPSNPFYVVTNGWVASGSTGKFFSDWADCSIYETDTEIAVSAYVAAVPLSETTTAVYTSFEEAWNAVVGLDTSEANRVTLRLLVDRTAVGGSFGTGIGFGTTGIAPNNSGNILVPAGKYLEIDLNGCDIDRALNDTIDGGEVIRVNGNLLLSDSSTTVVSEQGKIKGGNSFIGGGVLVDRANDTDLTVFTMNGGSITGNYSNNGGGVRVSSGTFTMNGGSITGNSTGSGDNDIGGGVSVNAGSEIGFNISGTVQITENFKGGTLVGGVYVKGESGTESNVYLASNKQVTISATFSGAIGITTQDIPTQNQHIVFTSGWSATGSTGTITSDNAGYRVINNSDNTEKLLSSYVTVTLKANYDGGGVDVAQKINIGIATNITAKPYSRVGYSFTGWATEESGAKVYYEAQEVTLSDDLTLYALWEEKTDVSINKTAKAAVDYSGEAVSFEIGGTHSGIGNFTIQYYLNTELLPTAPTSADSYDVKITRLEDDTYKVFECTITNGIVINPLSVDVTVNDTEKTYGDDNPAFSYTVELLNSDTLSGTAVYSTTATKYSDVDSYDVTISGMENSNYEITFIKGTLTVNPKAATVTVNDTEKTYGDDNPTFSYTVELLNSDTLTGTAVYSTTATRFSAVASYDVTVSGIANSNYEITFNKGTLTVNPRAVSVTVNDTEKTYGDDNPTFSYTVELLNSDTLTGTAVYSTTATKYSDVDSYDVTVSGIANSNYAITFNKGTLTVNPKEITVTAEGKASVHKAELVALTYTFGPALFEGDSFTGTLATTADITTVAEYDITLGTLSAGENYTIIFVGAKYNVTAKATASITQTAQSYGYDGSAKSFAILGSELTGFSVEYLVGGSYTATAPKSAGSYKVKVTRGEEASIYGYNVEIIDGLVITKQKVTKPTADTTVFVADGTSKTYTVTADSRYTVGGNVKTEVGSYTVSVALKDSANYEWADGKTTDITFDFVIRKPLLVEKTDKAAEKDDIIVTTKNGFAPDVVVSITAVLQAEMPKVTESLDQREEVVLAYDVKLLLDGKETQPDGTITLRILIPLECRGKAFRILHVHGEKITEVAYTVDGDYAIVTTDELSEFVFVLEKNDNLLWQIILLAIFLEAGLALVFDGISKRKKAK